MLFVICYKQHQPVVKSTTQGHSNCLFQNKVFPQETWRMWMYSSQGTGAEKEMVALQSGRQRENLSVSLLWINQKHIQSFISHSRPLPGYSAWWHRVHCPAWEPDSRWLFWTTGCSWRPLSQPQWPRPGCTPVCLGDARSDLNTNTGRRWSTVPRGNRDFAKNVWISDPRLQLDYLCVWPKRWHIHPTPPPCAAPSQSKAPRWHPEIPEMR